MVIISERAKITSKPNHSTSLECGLRNEDQPKYNATCDLIMHESPSSSTQNMQENPPKSNLGNAKTLCDDKLSLETIPPPTYTEATAKSQTIKVLN